MLTPFYCLFQKDLVLDGKAGRYYTPERTYAEAWRYASLTGASAGVSEGERSSVAR